MLKQTVEIEDNDFTHLELLGIIETVKIMIAQDWLEEVDYK